MHDLPGGLMASRNQNHSPLSLSPMATRREELGDILSQMNDRRLTTHFASNNKANLTGMAPNQDHLDNDHPISEELKESDLMDHLRLD